MKLVTSMLDSKSKQKHGSGQFKGQQSSHRIDSEAKAAEFDRSFAGKTLGYTRNGQPYLGQEVQKEYKY